MNKAARPLVKLASTPPPLPLAYNSRNASFTSLITSRIRLYSRPRHHLNHHRLFTTTNTFKMSVNAQSLIDLATARRSYYPLSKDLTITPARVQEIVKELLNQVPSSFNSQSNRVVVLFGADHEKLWDITTEILKAIVPADQFESTANKMAMFKGAAGTVRFFFLSFLLSNFFFPYSLFIYQSSKQSALCMSSQHN